MNATIRRNLTAFAVLLGSVFTAHAQAQFFNGNELLDRMKSSNNFTSGVAHGYVVGIMDTMSGITICSPGRMTIGQVHDIMLKYLNENPDIRHLPADVIIETVMSNRFPCSNKKGNV